MFRHPTSWARGLPGGGGYTWRITDRRRNDDASVARQNKESSRPINLLDDRMALLAALGCVSLVVSFNQDTPLELIKTVKPDHLVKGGDWQPDQIVGANFVTSYDGKVHAVPIRFERSTSDLIERIRRHG